MRVAGHLTYAQAPEVVYQTFLTPEALLYATPGLRTLTEVAPGQYNATMKVGLGGFELTYQGTLTVTDQVPHQQCRFVIDATTDGGYGRGEALFRFLPGPNGGTRAEYDVNLDLGGRQNLLPSLARGLVAFFMHGMADWLKRHRPRSPLDT